MKHRLFLTLSFLAGIFIGALFINDIYKLRIRNNEQVIDTYRYRISVLEQTINLRNQTIDLQDSLINIYQFMYDNK